MPDTVFRIQVGDDEYTNLHAFVKSQKLTQVTFDEAKIKGRYTVVVFADLTVKKVHITGTRYPNRISARTSSRAGFMVLLYRDDVAEIYQDRGLMLCEAWNDNHKTHEICAQVHPDAHTCDVPVL